MHLSLPFIKHNYGTSSMLFQYDSSTWNVAFLAHLYFLGILICLDFPPDFGQNKAQLPSIDQVSYSRCIS